MSDAATAGLMGGGDPNNPLTPYMEQIRQLHGFLDKDRDYRGDDTPPPPAHPTLQDVPLQPVTSLEDVRKRISDSDMAVLQSLKPGPDAGPIETRARQLAMLGTHLGFGALSLPINALIGLRQGPTGGATINPETGTLGITPEASAALSLLAPVGTPGHLPVETPNYSLSLNRTGGEALPPPASLLTHERPAEAPVTETAPRPVERPEATGQGRTATGEPDAGAPSETYASRSLAPSERLVNAPTVTIHSPQREIPGASAPDYHEFDPALGAQDFHDAVAGAKSAHRSGAQVELKTPAEYGNMRLFTTPDRGAGFALDGDNIVSVFKHPDSQITKAARSAMDLAVQQGGRRLDAFDTFLPHIYGENGFRVVARLPWNDAHAPEGWDYEANKGFNNGRPDVVFMVHDPSHQQPYKPGEGQRVDTYEQGEQAQRDALTANDNQPQPNALQRLLADTRGGGPNPFVRPPTNRHPSEPLVEYGPHEPAVLTAREKAQFQNPPNSKVHEAHYVMPEGQLLGTGDHDHEYISGTLGYGIGDEGIQRFRADTGAVLLNHPNALFSGPPTFQTADGWRLQKKGGVWTDGDVSFPDKGGRPVAGEDFGGYKKGMPLDGFMTNHPDVIVGPRSPTKQQVDQIARYVDKKGGATIADDSTGRMDHFTIGDQARAFLQPAQGFIDQLRKLWQDKKGGGPNPLEKVGRAVGRGKAALQQPLNTLRQRITEREQRAANSNTPDDPNEHLTFSTAIISPAEAKKQGINPHAPGQNTNLVNIQRYMRPELADLRAKHAGLIRDYGGIIGVHPDMSPDQAVAAFVNHVHDNVAGMYNLARKHWGDDVVRESSRWYEGAHNVANRNARDFSVTPQQASGVIAALSPQKEWNMNALQSTRLHMADEAARTLGDKAVFSPKMRDWIGDKYLAGLKARKEEPEKIERERKAFDEILDKPYHTLDWDQKARWARAWEESTFPDRSYRLISPTGEELDFAKNKDGRNRAHTWGSFGEMGNALKAMHGTHEEISQALGGQHKVRSFGNDILAPNSKAGHTTIDTHAVAVGLYRPLGAKAKEVAHALGTSPSPLYKGGPRPPGASGHAQTGISGMYPLFHEGYTRAAEDELVLPREMQSPTWEGGRLLFSDAAKRNKKFVTDVHHIWQDAVAKKASSESARAAVNEMARDVDNRKEILPLPEWVKSMK